MRLSNDILIDRNWDSADRLSLKDSGARREFATGAVRDISEGKGRCDLIPLCAAALTMPSGAATTILYSIERFKETKDISEISSAIKIFAELSGCDIYTLMLEVSKHYEAGALKYSENNWKKGLPLHCYIDSGVRHFFKYMRGDTDEPHDRAFVWNMLGAIWTRTNKPDLDDIEKDISKEDII